MNNRLTRNTWPLVIFLAAFLIRLIYLLQYRSNPSFYLPMVDELWHLEWARDIIDGNFRGDEAYFRGPLYPYVLAFLLKITGDSLFWVRLLQAVVGSLSAVMIYIIGRRLFVPVVGIIAALAYAAYGTIIFYESMLLIPVLFIFLNLVAVSLLLRFQGNDSAKHWLLAGIVVGLSAIARPNILILSPFFMVWIYLTLHNVDTRRKINLAGIFLVGILIPVLSVTARNYIVTGEPILISSQGGVNLYIGNNPETEGLTMLMPELDLNESLPWTEFAEATRIAAEREAGHPLTAAGESSFWTKKALVFIISNPGKFIGITFKKLVYFLIGFENSDQTDIYFSRTYSPLLSILLWKSPMYFPYGLLVPLAVIGMILSWPRRRELALLYVFIIGYIPTVILFLVTARHRLTVIPFLLLFAAFGAIALKDFAAKREWRKFTGYLAVFLIMLILCNRTYFDIGFENTAQIHFNLGLTYERQGDLVRAESEYLESLEANPGSKATRNNLGYVQYRLGKLDLAARNFETAIRTDPDFADAYNNLGLVHEARKDYANAERMYRRAITLDSNLYQAYINLGDIYQAREKYDQAEPYYRRAGEIDPRQKDAFTKLGTLYARQMKFQQADDMFRHAESIADLSAIDLLNWGNLYLTTKQAEPAIERYRKALGIDPNFARGYFNLAVVYHNFRYPVDSVRVNLETCLRLDPTFEPARELLSQIGN